MLRNYTQEDGLNLSYGYNIIQDQEGFIWIGGDNGIFRFDGTEFRQYKERPGFKNVETIACEALKSGELFIISYLNPVAYFKGNRLVTAEDNPELKKIQFGNAFPNVFRNDSMTQLLFFRHYSSEYAYLFRNGKVVEYPVFVNDTLNARTTCCFLYDFSNSDLYYTKDNSQLMAFNLRTRKISRCNIDLSSPSFLSGKGHFFVMWKNNTLVIYKLVAPLVFKKVRSFALPEKVYQIFIDDVSGLWVCLQNGGALYFEQPFTDAVTLAKPVKFLEDYIINGLLRDRDGNIWFNSKNNGLFFLPEKIFKTYIHRPLKHNTSHYTAIAANQNFIFLGQNTCKASIYHDGSITEFTLDKSSKSECRSVFANERVAIFGQSDRAFLLDLSSHKMEYLPWLTTVKNIIPYSRTSALMCTSGQVLEYDFVTRKSTVLVHEKIYTALPYDTDSLFMGTLKDLHKFNIKDKTMTLFLEGYYFNDLKKLGRDLYAGATRLNGIVLFNSQGVLRHITRNEGLASNQVKKIEVENEHTLWASTGKGLSRISMVGSQTIIKNFTRIDGMPSENVSGCVIRKDTIYVATSNGLGIFAIKDLLNQDWSIHKKVIINSVSFGGNELADSVHSFTATYPDNTIIFNLSFLDYASQGKIRYRYKTEGLNQDWQISTSSKIILNSLPPGNYTFKVYGMGYNGQESDRYTALTFEIKPLFWQSRWFYTLVGLTLVGSLIVLVNYFIRKRRNKKLKTLLYEKKIAELELQAIKAQINPHFIYNCLNSIQFLLYKKEYEETEDYLDRFSKMIRQTLQYSEKTFMPIQEEIDYLTLYLDLEKLRFKGHFKYAIHVSEDVGKDWKIPSLLIQPFVENSIKHGISRLRDREGFVEVRFERHGQCLVIIIQDNGVGIRNRSLPSKAGSFGILLSRKRIEVFRQLFATDITLEIQDLSVSGQYGTKIVLNLNLPL